jgi:phosphatidylglycerol:prolipoprotein diacylglycerol transferase
MIAGIERFLVEFIRRNDDVVAGLTEAQLIALAMLVLGATIVAIRHDVPHPATA